MSLILQIETATPVCSIALAYQGKVLAYKEMNATNAHASWITLLIQEVMAESSYNLTQLDAVAVSKGPGSYTGLRIGVSTAKGLCYALGTPLIAVNTLEAMAAGVIGVYFGEESTLFCPMLDARRMEVYTALYNQKLEAILPTEAKIVDECAYTSILRNQRVLFFGNGVSKLKHVLEHPHASFLDAYMLSAKDMTSLAFNKYQSKIFEDMPYFEPFYLKDFVTLASTKLYKTNN